MTGLLYLATLESSWGKLSRISGSRSQQARSKTGLLQLLFDCRLVRCGNTGVLTNGKTTREYQSQSRTIRPPRHERVLHCSLLTFSECLCQGTISGSSYFVTCILFLRGSASSCSRCETEGIERGDVDVSKRALASTIACYGGGCHCRMARTAIRCWQSPVVVPLPNSTGGGRARLRPSLNYAPISLAASARSIIVSPVHAEAPLPHSKTAPVRSCRPRQERRG